MTVDAPPARNRLDAEAPRRSLLVMMFASKTFARRARALLCLPLGLLPAALAFAACDAQDQAIHADDYNQHCAQDSDCAPIIEGPISCCQSDCNDNAAINTADLSRYEDDRTNRSPSCDGKLCPNIACAPGQAFCIHGRCALATNCGAPISPMPCPPPPH